MWTKTNPNPMGLALNDETTVSCSTDGYIFQQEPYIQQKEVTIKCGLNGWNVTLLPNCTGMSTPLLLQFL